jgi:hypothetical protein
MYFSGDFPATFLVLTSVAYLMMLAGLRKNALEWRRRRFACPSCGVDRRRCRCRV